MRNNKIKHKRKTFSSEINITPFVDVLLIVLLAFMVTAPMMNSGFDVNLPKSSSAPVLSNDTKKVNIVVKPSGEMVYQGKTLLKESIASTFQSFSKETTQFFIQADKNAKYQYVISLMSELHAQGFISISLMTEQDK